MRVAVLINVLQMTPRVSFPLAAPPAWQLFNL